MADSDSDPDNGNPPQAAVGGSGALSLLAPFIAKGVTELAIKLMYHYNEILKAWESCGSDKMCRGEQAVHYISKIFGMSRPALVLSVVVRQLINRMWIGLRGKRLLDDSDWNSTGLGLVVYGGLEWLLSPLWVWVEEGTECLKKENCEGDDILIWIENMKLGYCGTIEDAMEEDDRQVEMDVSDWEIEESMKLCSTFWNETPLIMLTVLIWIVYLLASAVNIDHNINLEPPPSGNRGGDGGKRGKGDGKKKGRKSGDGKGSKPEGDDKGGKPKDDDKKGKPGEDDKNGKSGGGDKRGKSGGKDTKAKPKEDAKDGKPTKGDQKGKQGEGDEKAKSGGDDKRGKSGGNDKKGNSGGDDKGGKPKEDDKKGKPGGAGKSPDKEKDKNEPKPTNKPKTDDKKGKPKESKQGKKTDESKTGGTGKASKNDSKKGDGTKNKGCTSNGSDTKGKKDKDAGGKDGKPGGTGTVVKCGSGKPSQEILLACPCCRLQYTACFPDPVVMYCEECGGNNPGSDPPPPSSPTPTEPQPSPPEEPNQPEPCPSSSSSNAFHPHDLEEIDDPLRQSARCDDWKVAMSRPHMNGEADNDNSLEALPKEELYQLLWETAEEHYQELMECLEPLCPDCGYKHTDHFHTGESEEEPVVTYKNGETQTEESELNSSPDGIVAEEVEAEHGQQEAELL